MWTAPVLIASVMLCSGCFAPRVIPDPSIAHRISRPVEVWEWRRQPDGSLAENCCQYPAGYWIASPQLVEEPAATIKPKDHQ